MFFASFGCKRAPSGLPYKPEPQANESRPLLLSMKFELAREDKSISLLFSLKLRYSLSPLMKCELAGENVRCLWFSGKNGSYYLGPLL